MLENTHITNYATLNLTTTISPSKKPTAIQMPEKFPALCPNSKVHGRAHVTCLSPLTPVLMLQTNPVRTHTSHYFTDHFNIEGCLTVHLPHEII